MRILLIPRIKTIDGTGSFTIDPMNLIKYFRLINPSCYFYVAVHEDFRHKDWMKNYDLTAEDIEHVSLIPMPHSVVGTMKRRSTRRASYFFAQALSDKIGPKDEYGKFFDVVIAESVLNVPMIRSVIEGLYQKGYSCRVPYTAWVHWCPVPKWYISYYNEFDAYSEVYGSLFCDGIVFASKRQENDFKVTWQEHFKSSVVEKLKDKSILCNLGVEIDEIKRKQYDSNKKPVVLWSGYTSEDYLEIKSVLLKEICLGRVEKVIFQFLDEECPEEEIRELSKIKNVNALGRINPYTKYLEFLHEADIFVAISQNIPRLTYGRRWGEMIASGLVPIVSRDIRDTFFDDGYPFTVTPDVSLSILLPSIVKYLSKDKSVLDKYHGLFYENHNIVDSMRNMYNFVSNLVTRASEEVNYTVLGGAVRRALKGVEEIGHWQAVKIIEAQMKSKNGCGLHSMFTQKFVRKCIMNEGYRDIGLHVPVYKKI